jgi:hypothetical protein
MTFCFCEVLIVLSSSSGNTNLIVLFPEFVEGDDGASLSFDTNTGEDTGDVCTKIGESSPVFNSSTLLLDKRADDGDAS